MPEGADNHDVLMMQMFDSTDGVDHWNASEHTMNSTNMTDMQRFVQELEHQFIGIGDSLGRTVEELQNEEMAHEEHIARLEDKVPSNFEADLARRVAQIEELHLEKLEGKEEQLIQRIAEAEANTWRDLEQKLLALEKSVEDAIVDKLSARVGTLEAKFSQSVEKRMLVLEQAMGQYIEEQARIAAQRLSWSWRVPLVGIFVVLTAGAAWVWFDLSWLANQLLARTGRMV